MSKNGFKTREIKGEKTIGEFLVNARKQHKYSLEDVEKATKIRTRYLEALEKNKFEQLPSDVYVKGFLKTYAGFLQLDPQEMIDLYHLTRGTTASSLKEDLIMPEKKINQPKIVITPRVLIISLVIVVILGILSYIYLQVIDFTRPPVLEIKNPPGSELVTTEEKITFEGHTDEGSSVTINNQPVAIDPDGSFKQEVSLSNGLNQIVIVAQNRVKKKTIKEVKVLVKF